MLLECAGTCQGLVTFIQHRWKYIPMANNVQEFSSRGWCCDLQNTQNAGRLPLQPSVVSCWRALRQMRNTDNTHALCVIVLLTGLCHERLCLHCQGQQKSGVSSLLSQVLSNPRHASWLHETEFASITFPSPGTGQISHVRHDVSSCVQTL